MRKGRLKCTTLPFPTVQHTGQWIEKDLHTTPSIFLPSSIWSDGTDIYLSKVLSNQVLKGNKWENHSWNVSNLYYGIDVWTDGENIYYSHGSTQYVLVDGAWEPKEWNVAVQGRGVWSDGVNIYYTYVNSSEDVNHSYVLDSGTWKPKIWNGIDEDDNFSGEYIWSDGVNIYYSCVIPHYVLNGDTWKKKNWNVSGMVADELWTDGVHVYLNSSGALSNEYCCVLQGDEFVDKDWNIPINNGSSVWTDGVDICYVRDGVRYVLERTPTVPQLNHAAMLMAFVMGMDMQSMREQRT